MTRYPQVQDSSFNKAQPSPKMKFKLVHLFFAFVLCCQSSISHANKVPAPGRGALKVDRGPIKIVPRPLPGRGRPLPGGRELAKKPPAWASYQHVFIATLDKVVAGPVGRSFPPMFTHKLTFTIKDSIRGNLKPGDSVEVSHVARQRVAPVFPKGKDCVVGAEKSRGSIQAKSVEPFDAKTIASIRLACSLPLGWAGNAGRIISPWAGLKAKWPSVIKEGAEFFCSTSGRPALWFGSGAEFAVEKVPPEEAIKWTNPDGDGEYRITVSNTGEKPVSVPALRRIGDKILWQESVVILCQGKTYASPESKGLSVATSPTLLKPGQKLSGVINALALEGPEWPKGGYRISFQFCLGERSSTQSFYYMSRHHDGIRAKLKKGQSIRSQGD